MDVHVAWVVLPRLCRVRAWEADRRVEDRMGIARPRELTSVVCLASCEVVTVKTEV